MEKPEVLVTLLCATQVLHENLDDLQDTKFYRHELKRAAKNFEKELTKTCDKYINLIFTEDEDVSNLVMEGIAEISKELASLHPDSVAYVGMVIKKERERKQLEDV